MLERLLSMLRVAPSSLVSVAMISAVLTAAVAVPLALDSGPDESEPTQAIGAPALQPPESLSVASATPTATEVVEAEVAGISVTPPAGQVFEPNTEAPQSDEQADPTTGPVVVADPTPEAGGPTALSATPTPMRAPEEPERAPTAEPIPTATAAPPAPSTDLIATVVGGTLTSGVSGPLDVQVLNIGSETAPNVALEIVIGGADIVAVSISDPKWRCSSSGGAITCASDSLDAGEVVSAELELEPTSNQLTLEVAVSHTLVEDTPTDNTVDISMETGTRPQGGSLSKA
ncbi:MAG: hypothetical protein ACR2PK_11960 [Acidimicrobiales bacterium]